MDEPKILVIDDEPIARITIEAILKAHNFKIFFAENGLDGIQLAKQVHPDIIFLDVMMPHMNGFQACKIIRGTDGLSEVPILMVTALDDKKSRIEGLESGADDFISKPYDIFEIQAKIKTLTRLNRYRQLVEQRQKLEVLHTELLVAYEQTIEGWSAAMDLRDKETEGHTQRVTEMVMELAGEYQFSEDELTQIRLGSLLHDIGKLGIPDSILLKDGPLSADEWIIMRKHPVYAYDWLSKIGYLRFAKQIPFSHHEKWDGTGYPQGLKGEEIPLIARLFAVVDVWDALTSDRPYRAALPPEKAWEYIKSNAGSHFDPHVVELFERKFSNLFHT
ncbi:MAG TPA: HD domain-containing phosphohydrolase [Anaerolineales bacterium]|nr:HD domain-containing phosphohydrolase [Anaerolineales bacterium]